MPSSTSRSVSVLRRFGDRWVRWGDRIADKITAALHVVALPATAAQIVPTIGTPPTLAAVREVLSSDDRSIRTSKTQWALRMWGHDEYGGIAGELGSRIDAAGGWITVGIAEKSKNRPASPVRALMKARVDLPFRSRNGWA